MGRTPRRWWVEVPEVTDTRLYAGIMNLGIHDTFVLGSFVLVVVSVISCCVCLPLLALVG